MPGASGMMAGMGGGFNDAGEPIKQMDPEKMKELENEKKEAQKKGVAASAPSAKPDQSSKGEAGADKPKAAKGKGSKKGKKH